MASSGSSMLDIDAYSQIDMKQRPTMERHLVRWQDMIDYVSGKIKNPVRLVVNSDIGGSFTAGTRVFEGVIFAADKIDGVLVAVGDRILVDGQLDATQNGIYVIDTMTPGISDAPNTYKLVAADDWNETADIKQGVKVPVAEGDANADSTYVLITDPPYNLGTSNSNFIKEPGQISKVTQYTFPIVGDGATLDFTFNHNLQTKNFIAEVYEDSTGETIIVAIVRTSVNDVLVSFSVAPLSGQNFTLVLHTDASATTPPIVA